MKPFVTPPWREKVINEKYRRKDKVVTHAVNSMEIVMESAVEQIWNHFEMTGRFSPPSLHSMDAVSENFYHSIIVEAFHFSKHEKLEQKGKKRLAKLPTGIPRRLPSLEKFFRDKRNWERIMKRSKKLTARLCKSYFEKLQRQFDKLVPMLDKGEITPKEAKAHLMEAWNASKSRVETIFRTETTTYFTKTQIAFFSDDPDIIGFLFDSLRDRARTEWCRSRHGLIYKPGSTELAKNQPPCHWNCRSHLIPLANTAYNRKLLEDPDRDPTKRKVAPLPDGWRK